MCLEENCSRPASSRGYCHMHYMRRFRAGERHDRRPQGRAFLIEVDGITVGRIPLTQGHFAIVDEEDIPRLYNIDWYAIIESGRVRAAARINGEFIYMHQFILWFAPGELSDKDIEVDHRDRDTLNNRKANLRTVTHTENMRNTARHINRVGYCYNKRAKLYCVYLDSPGQKRKYLGYTKTEEQARDRVAQARNAAN